MLELNAEQNALYNRLIQRVFCTIRHLTRNHRAEQAMELAHAYHNLPLLIIGCYRQEELSRESLINYRDNWLQPYDDLFQGFEPFGKTEVEEFNFYFKSLLN